MNIAKLMTNLRSTLLVAALLLFVSTPINAQRFTDNLGRGLVVLKAYNSNYLSWRKLGTEYYDVTYNVYRNNALIASGLTVTSYRDSNSSETNTYQIEAVKNTTSLGLCNEVSPWPGYVYTYSGTSNAYLDLSLATVYDRNGNDVTEHYEPNDAEFADLDGDGELEMIIKRLNTVDAAGVSTGTYTQNGIEIFNIYPNNSKEFVVLDAYDINWQTGATTLLWRIDCGPNMVSSNSTEINIIAYDWDEDGAAEVVLRGADNMIIYGNNGRTRLHEIGDMNVNTRQNWMSHRQSDGTNLVSMAYTKDGSEYLLYINGQTGALYQKTDYPLKRLENGETDLNAAWGDGYGHRSSKYFFGAPFLDGKKASLFLARGIYTRHKMIAMDVDKDSHTWGERWRWNNNTNRSPWFGQGYHNFIIADVDEDGRDEIVYGSMVIDDTGNGLSTTGLGHGDAEHVTDIDPWRKGLEFFGCNEDNPAMNYRNATTSEIYVRYTATDDDGRCLAGNFRNDYPGSQLKSSSMSDWLSATKDITIDNTKNMTVDNTKDIPEDRYNHHLNFRIYWDGDLCSEVFDSGGSGGGAGTITKPGSTEGALGSRLANLTGSSTNNGTKNNSCFQGDIIGDWREEVVMRLNANTVRIFSSNINTNYALPTLWHDHQYRQAMVWQMMAYNQPPHLSYFLGEMEGYTVAPPPLTTRGREVVGNNTNIDGNYNGKHVLHNEYDNTSISISGGSPAVLTINVPAWVQGHDNNNNITTTTYTCNLTGGAMSGETRLVKQGNGILNMSNAVHANTGNTDIWGGTVNFDGTMQNSAVWMNRHTTLNTTGGAFNKGLTMEYGATLNVGGGDCSRVNISELTLNYGARVVLDVNGMGDAEHDWLNATTLNIDDSKVGIDAWENYGPQYITPVFQIRMQTTLGEGRYPIGNVTTVNGDLSAIVLKSDLIGAEHLSLEQENGVLYLRVSDVATANEATIALTGMAPYEDVATPYPSASPDNYYLPVISIVANNTNGQAPTLSGTFTTLDGTEKSIGSNEEPRTLFSENFEGSTTASNYWKNNNEGSSIFLPDYANSDGQCIGIKSSNDRGDYTPINADYTGISAYYLDFDAYFNNASKTTDFAVMSKSHLASWTFNYGYDWQTNTTTVHNPFLFFIRRGAGSTTFAVNESSTSLILNNSTWYHFTLTVDMEAGTVGYNIMLKGSTTPVASGTYTLQPGESAECDGIYIRNGRYQYEPGGAGIDNIVIKSAPTSLNSFTFTEPGTLRVMSSVEGYASSVKTFEVQYPFIKTGNSGDISNDYLPVAIHDELATSLPQKVETQGNVHLWRNGLAGTSTWATMVVPFDMTVAQVREVFGEGVTVANLEIGKGTGSQIYFETIEVETANGNITTITANKPCLIKGVTKEAPYLIMGITSEPVQEPSVTNGHFTFVGTYIDLGQKAFTTNDYFFTTSGLSRVETNGTTMRLKGYRGYFEGLTSNGAKNIQTVFEKSDVVTGILDVPTTTRNEVYDLQGRKIPENWRRKKGIYIVNGRKMIVK